MTSVDLQILLNYDPSRSRREKKRETIPNYTRSRAIDCVVNDTNYFRNENGFSNKPEMKFDSYIITELVLRAASAAFLVSPLFFRAI